jgi:predicted FMN-binding regulatory protein PaiB
MAPWWISFKFAEPTTVSTLKLVSDAPADYLNDKLDGIVGFEILITQVLAKSKLSQNKSDADRLGAAHTLGDHPIAGRMQNLHSK